MQCFHFNVVLMQVVAHRLVGELLFHLRSCRAGHDKLIQIGFYVIQMLNRMQCLLLIPDILDAHVVHAQTRWKVSVALQSRFLPVHLQLFDAVQRFRAESVCFLELCVGIVLQCFPMIE